LLFNLINSLELAMGNFCMIHCGVTLLPPKVKGDGQTMKTQPKTCDIIKCHSAH
jgi:hypothetical protein